VANRGAGLRLVPQPPDHRLHGQRPLARLLCQELAHEGRQRNRRVGALGGHVGDGGEEVVVKHPPHVVVCVGHLARQELRVALEGFRAEPVPVDASAAARDVGSLALTVSAVSETLVVSASQVEIPLSQSSSAVTVITGEELRDRQVTIVADALRSRQVVIINLQGADRTLLQRVVDFTSGVAYTIDGRIQKLADAIYLVVPAGVNVNSAGLREQIDTDGLVDLSPKMNQHNGNRF